MPRGFRHFIRMPRTSGGNALSGTAGMQADAVDVKAQLVPRPLPLFLVFGLKQQVRRRFHHQPVVVNDFLFQLPRAPAAVAERYQVIARSFAESDVVQHVDGGRNGKFVVDRQSSLSSIVQTVQDKTADPFQRTALMKDDRLNRRRAADVKLADEVGKIKFFQLFVHHKAHGAFLIVHADIDHRTRENVVIYMRHGNQTFAGKIIVDHFHPHHYYLLNHGIYNNMDRGIFKLPNKREQ